MIVRKVDFYFISIGGRSMVNETVLRWKARLGQLKAAGLLIIIFGGIGLMLLSDSLAAALNNSTDPQPVVLDRLIKGEIQPNQYIAVLGIAQYDMGYVRTTDSTKEEYYYLIEKGTGNMLLIKSPTLIPENKPAKTVTLYGVTHAPSSKLQTLIEGDLADYKQQGLKTSSKIYLGEGEMPPSRIVVLLPAIVIGVLMVLSIATFFFPNTVFAAMPIDGGVMATDYSTNVQATGQFLKLAAVQPSIQIGKGTRKFVRSVANIWPMPDRSWLIYIHFIYTYRVNGVPVRKTETDWGLPLNSTNVTDIQPGKLFGWRDRWAVRFQYKDDQLKQQTMFVSFKEPGAQVAFVRALSQSGMYVGSGEVAAFGS
jgi:hypothetical protein